LLIQDIVLVELKAARGIDSAHIAQLLDYLRCTSIETGLILNFGPRPQIRRLIFTNDRKSRVQLDTSSCPSSSVFVCVHLWLHQPQMNTDTTESYAFTATGRPCASGSAWTSIRMP
jgi:PD-(D/E)XK nuclease superfamily